MTTAPHPFQFANTPATAAAREAPNSPEIRVAWTIASEALRAARPDLAIREDIRVCSLVWTIGPGGDAEASLEFDGSPFTFPLVPSGLGADTSHHEPTSTIAVTVPGMLELVIDARSGKCLYARTTLLSALGIPGGAYRTASRPAQG